MNVKSELHIAADRNQRVTIKLRNGEKITGVTEEVSADPERAKVRTTEGPVWVPHKDIDKVSRVIAMLKK